MRSEKPYGSRKIYFGGKRPKPFFELVLGSKFASIFRVRGLTSERARWLALNIVPHERAIRAWLCRRAYDIDVDDIIQEMYARMAALESVEDIHNPRQYAVQAAASILMNQARHARIIPMLSVGDFEDLSPVSTEPSAERIVEARQELEQLKAHLQGLPDICRKAFLLRRAEGLSQKEVGERLGISIKTVEKYMARSVRYLIQVYGDGGKSESRVSNSQESHSPAIKATTNK